MAFPGSFTRSDIHKENDMDILMDFKTNIDGYDYIRLAPEFDDLSKRKVDMVSRRSIKPHYLPL